MQTWMLFPIMAVLIALGAVATFAFFARKRRAEDEARSRGISVGNARASMVSDVPLDVATTRKLLETNIGSMPRYSLRDPHGSTLLVRARTNLWSWGTVLEIHLDEVDGGTTAAALAYPKVSTTLIDWGQGGKDIWDVMEPLVTAGSSR